MKSFKRVTSQLRQHWENLVASSHRKMSRGAEYISKIITSAHRDEWRRGREKKK